MSIELALALLLAVALVIAMVTVFRRGTRRVRAELQAVIREHNAALAQLVDGEQIRWEREPGDFWGAVVRESPGGALRLGIAPVMRRSTFILYVTRLRATPPANRRFALPARGDALQIAMASADQVPAALRALRLSAALERQLTALALGLRLEAQRLELTARPAEPVIRRYSYGIELQRDPDALRELLAAGEALAAALVDGLQH